MVLPVRGNAVKLRGNAFSVVRRSVFWIAVCLVTGAVSSLVQAESLRLWYPALVKSSLTPPDAVFPIVWTTLYLLMGLSMGLVRASLKPEKGPVTAIFLAQLALGFCWCFCFFTLQRPVLGLGVISAMLPLLVAYVWKSCFFSRTAAWLFAPAIPWTAFAWYLNVSIVLYN